MDDPAIVPATQFKNRKIGLNIFGLITLLAGCCCALFVPLAIIGLQVAAKSPNPPRAPQSIIPIVALYGTLAVILVWLGIGSILARRWARALLVISSWSLFIIGIVTVVVVVLMTPRLAELAQASQSTAQPKLSDGAKTAMMFVSAAMLTVIMVILPLVWALFYGGKNVKATCEAINPAPAWTDRCPLPVLAMSLWLFFSAVTTLLVPAYNSAAPFFGLLLSRAPTVGFYLCLAVVWGYGGWRMYLLDARGWWIVVATYVIFTVSNLITYWLHNPEEMYSRMQYSPAQIDQIRRIGFMDAHTMIWSSLLTLPSLAYLLYLRKFFKREQRVVAAEV
jgi:hypothetical protein